MVCPSFVYCLFSILLLLMVLMFLSPGLVLSALCSLLVTRALFMGLCCVWVILSVFYLLKIGCGTGYSFLGCIAGAASDVAGSTVTSGAK